MCGLCGLLGEDLHWSDPLGDELPRRRERLRRIAAINQVLAVFRLKVEDFQGASYLLLGATGKQALASGLVARVFPAAEFLPEVLKIADQLNAQSAPALAILLAGSA